MLTLAFDRTHRVLRVSISGIFASEEMDELDRVVIDFLAREGPVRGIYDYSEVEAFALPHNRVMRRAQQPAIVRDQRVIVASRAVGGNGFRNFGRYQREAGGTDAAVVDSLEEAYNVLDLEQPRFEPIERG